MQLVVKGIDRFRRIISAGYSDYTVGLNQSLVEIDDADWKGYRKSDVHWDDEIKKIIEKPYPLSVAELAEKQEQEEKETYIAAMPDLVKSLETKIVTLEAKEITP